MDTNRKKELRNSYESRTVVGGICCIRCSGNNRIILVPSRSIESSKNRFNFAISSKTSPDPRFNNEHKQYGPESFSFEVLDEVERGEEQSAKDFANDINVLLEIWIEKYENGELR